MKRAIWLILALLLLAACGGSDPTPEPVAPPAPAEDTDAERVPTAGKPQLIEFYAEW